MKKSLQSGFLTALLVVAISLPAVGQARTQMGVNYNGEISRFNIHDVTVTRTTWIRAFFDVTKLLQKQGTCDMSTVKADPNLTAINTIHKDYPQYAIALSLKYDFREWGGGAPPTATNGAVYTTLKDCTKRVLHYVYPSLSLLVTGNEPFITNPPTMEAVTKFYENITNFDIKYNVNHAEKSLTGKPIPLYVGAFNNLEKPNFQTTPVDELMQYARNTAGVTGIDLHLHVSSFNGDNGVEGIDPTGGLVAAVRYAQSIFGTKKPMMSSEFSLVNYFQKYLRNNLSSSFLSKYPDPGSEYVDVTGKRSVLGFINYTLRSGGVSTAEWYEFLKSGNAVHPTWFTDRVLPSGGHKSFLGEAEDFFSANHFTVATYGIVQGGKNQLKSRNPSLPYAIQPFILNSLFCNFTCRSNPTTGYDSRNLDWIGDFWAQQP